MFGYCKGIQSLIRYERLGDKVRLEETRLETVLQGWEIRFGQD